MMLCKENALLHSNCCRLSFNSVFNTKKQEEITTSNSRPVYLESVPTTNLTTHICRHFVITDSWS